MDHSTWSAYSQHLSRLGASMNPSSGSLSQTSQLNDLPLPPALQRQDHLGGYGNTAAPHHFLLAPSHGLNPSQTPNRSDHSFGASSLFVANYDSSLLTAPFQSSNKGHLPAFPQGPGFFKAVGRDSDFTDLRTGFSHCGMPPYGRNPDGNGSLPGAPALGSNALFPNSMSSGSWRPSGIMPSSCGPFGVLPHETVLQRSHLVRRNEKQSSKSSRSSHSGASFMEQDLSRGYRGILSSPARPPSSFMEHGNPNHSSLLSPQNDPYFSSVTDSYYNSCSKTDFSAYGSYCSNMPSGMPRGAISPYCYPQTFGTIEAMNEKQEHSSVPNSVPSANSNFSNVPNSYSHNTNYPQNGLMPRQTVITSNANTPSVTVSSQMQDSRMAYTQREVYNCSTGSNHTALSNRPATAHSVPNHHSFSGQTHYPPMSTPIPAATPAHPTPPSTMGQAHVPQLLAMNQDSGCSSMVYNSPTNESCYSTPGTSHSGSTSPSKQDLSQHSSPAMYSVESNNMRMNSSPFIDPNRMHPHQCLENREMPIINTEVAANMHENVSDSSPKAPVNMYPTEKPSSIPPDHLLRSKVPEDPSITPKHFQEVPPQGVFENHIVDINNGSMDRCHKEEEENISLQPENLVKESCKLDESCSPPALDYTQKEKSVAKLDKNKQDCSSDFSYPESNSHPLPPPPPLLVPSETEKVKDLDTQITPGSTESDMKSDVPVLPVDLSHVSLNLSTKKEKTFEEEEELPDDVTPEVKTPKMNYEHSLLSSNWPLRSTEDDSSSNQQPTVQSNNEPKKEDQQLCLASSLDDLSEESKNKLNNIDEDLGFLAELSATSDADEGTSKEDFVEKKRKKKKKPGFLQTFLTFLENSNDAPSTSEALKEKQGESGKKVSKMSLFDNKNVENAESNWPLSKALEKMSGENKTKNGEDKISEPIVQDKDTFEEAPSFDSGLFSCNTLQKEMVVPNPEAPSFSSDEDENSAQGIFDSVAMAIQRLCDDNEEDNHGKGESSGVSKSKGESSSSSSKQKSSKAHETTADNELLEEVNDLQPDSENVEEPVVPALIVKQRRGKRKKGRHLLVIKVNHLKKPNVVVPPTLCVSNKVKKRPLQSVRKLPPSEGSSDNGIGRRSLMRKCKQKRFQRNSETKRKRKTRNPGKRKHETKEQEEKDDAMDEVPNVSQRTAKVINIKNIPDNMKPTVKISIISPTASTSTAVIREEVPKKVKKVSRKRQKKKKHHRQHKKSGLLLSESKDEETTNNVLPYASVSGLNLAKKTESICSETNSQDNEVHFKTGDYVTLAESKEDKQIPIWRIVGKNVLQLFEVFEDRETSSLYRNTTSYSRWSPSSKHKYSKLTVKVIKCDDDSVIIEMAKSAENKETSGLVSFDSYAAHPQRENFEVYLQTLVSHALDPDFIPEIVKENDEYFLTHLRAIEKITAEKKEAVLSGIDLDCQFRDSAEAFPDISIKTCTESESSSCRLCQGSSSQYTVHFHGQLYDAITLENKVESSTSDWEYPLCGSCVQRMKLYNKLQHHKYHFYQLGCKKVKDVRKGDEKDSHAILEECLQDANWMSQMFHDMMELWSACNKFR